MFKKILIANRGEIACRIIKTARRMGIATVAVYSEADEGALHVGMADEAVGIGPAPSADSYLRIDRIIEACKKTGAEAVHPGYGFLSERSDFATALAEAGIVFIGPSPGAIGAMGDKIAAKRLADQAGVATVPGHLDTIADAERAVAIAAEIGYPVMIKASAGGGGKGMRVAHDEAELREGFSGARHEAGSSFGDDRIFLEKYIEEPRHIEIQVLGDMHGNIVHLGERECSIQRRHQTVLEEAPSPCIDAETRAAMGAQAVALARAVGYRSVGTVEFIVDRQHNFYFLEMNTRLQVEHPVTELVTGLDLVELMIRVAAGGALPFDQAAVRQVGWAIEARIYAEDPARNFLPSIGRLVRYRPPDGDGLRVDSGVVEGDEITLYYDPMIAKLIAYGSDRKRAIERLRSALDRFYIGGVRHNIAFLGAIAESQRFGDGVLSTEFISEEFPNGFVPPADPVLADKIMIVAAAIAERRLRECESRDPGDPQLAAWRRESRVVLLDGRAYPVSIHKTSLDYGVESPSIDMTAITDWRPGEPLLRLGSIDDDEVATVQIEMLRGRAFRLAHGGVVRHVQVLSPRAAELLLAMPKKEPADTSRLVLSPMPGLLTAIVVEEGQDVKAGEPLVTVEAMKMENVLRAERDGRVAKLRAKPGDSLAVDQIILELE
ncbi:MAG TPA: acetyl/propionyl/methylcrotonyl-CoA carboxylase subunit alpha [Stellaceae bacterium]|nr:acetyl/propionyl/methylcrotonyl-CoA carboxylase subunit alpha [Stellaceae bacterium]